MKFSDLRQTVLKGFVEPDLHNPATPRLLSPYRDGRRLRSGVLGDEVFNPVENRASRRKATRKVRRFRRGVALYPVQMPWNPEPFKS